MKKPIVINLKYDVGDTVYVWVSDDTPGAGTISSIHIATGISLRNGKHQPTIEYRICHEGTGRGAFSYFNDQIAGSKQELIDRRIKKLEETM